MTNRIRLLIVGVLVALVVGPILVPAMPAVRFWCSIVFLALGAWLVIDWLRSEHGEGTAGER